MTWLIVLFHQTEWHIVVNDPLSLHSDAIFIALQTAPYSSTCVEFGHRSCPAVEPAHESEAKEVQAISWSNVVKLKCLMESLFYWHKNLQPKFLPLCKILFWQISNKNHQLWAATQFNWGEPCLFQVFKKYNITWYVLRSFSGQALETKSNLVI